MRIAFPPIFFFGNYLLIALERDTSRQIPIFLHFIELLNKDPAKMLLKLLLLSSPFLSFAAASLRPYAPLPAICPCDPLVRPANRLSTSEEAYRVARKAVANPNLKAWLLKTHSGFGTDDLPTVRCYPISPDRQLSEFNVTQGISTNMKDKTGCSDDEWWWLQIPSHRSWGYSGTG